MDVVENADLHRRWMVGGGLTGNRLHVTVELYEEEFVSPFICMY